MRSKAIITMRRHNRDCANESSFESFLRVLFISITKRIFRKRKYRSKDTLYCILVQLFDPFDLSFFRIVFSVISKLSAQHPFECYTC